MRLLRSVSESAASFLCMIMVGCAALDDGRSHSETGRTSTPLPPVKDARNLGVPLEYEDRAGHSRPGPSRCVCWGAGCGQHPYPGRASPGPGCSRGN